MTIQSYPIVAYDQADDGRKHRREMANVLNGAMRGKLNCLIEVELAVAAVQTVVRDDRLHADCAFLFDPLDEIADAAVRTGPLFIAEADRGFEQCTITHADDVGGARFRVVIIG